MKQIIEGEKKRITTVNEQMITRDSKTKQIVNRNQEKDFRMCYDKRCMEKTESGIETLPRRERYSSVSMYIISTSYCSD